MTSYTWASAVNGNWGNASDWNPHGIPGSAGGDTATINATGSGYTVTYNEASETVNDLTINSAAVVLSFSANDTLTVNGTTDLIAGTINVTASGSVFNAGSLIAAVGTTIDINNSASISTFNGMSYYDATLNGLVNLTGNGTAVGSDSAPIALNGTIEATTGSATLNFAALSGTGTLAAVGAKLNVAGSLAGTSTHIVISNSSLSVFETTGTLYYGDSLSASFLGPNGEFEYNNSLDDTHITFDLSGLNAGNSTTTPTNFFDFGNQSVSISSGGSGAGTTGSVVMSNGDTLALSGISGIVAGGWAAHTASDGSGGTELFLSSVCYVAGTHILTSDGERTIESLLPGEMVATLSGSKIIQQPIKWIGRRRVDIAAHPRPDTVVPIRVCRHAVADNVPRVDLLVSPDHAILFDGKLICARQLVNGTTIRQDIRRPIVEYLHIELDEHAILLAEGLPAESYLDTGNRRFFGNGGQPLVLHPDLTKSDDFPTRVSASCHPFVWDEASVQPIWQRLAIRAAELGHPVASIETTTDPNLCVATDRQTLRPLCAGSGSYTFALPRGITEVRLTSRAGAPSDVRPWLEDRRRLGVYVRRIVLRDAGTIQEIPLDHPALSQGWWDTERDGSRLCRWTNGDAVLPLPESNGSLLLELHADNGNLSYAVNNDARPDLHRVEARAV